MSVKLCECGCGRPAPIARRTNRAKGHVKGEPVRFVCGHHNRGKAMPKPSPVNGGVCSIDGCDMDASSRGWCQKHYARWYRNGHTDRVGPEPVKSEADRVQRKRASRLRSYHKTKEEYRDRKRAINAAYRERNREKLVAAQREYAARNPEVVNTIYRNRRARVRGAKGRLSKGIVKRLLRRQKNRCVACRADLRETGHHLDHRVPLAKGGTNKDSNVQLLCPSCNCSKGARDPVEFMQEKGWLL